MRTIRIRYVVQGAHVHCRLFTAPHPDQTFAKCGDLVFSLEEWPDVYAQLTAGGVQFLPDSV